MRLVAAAALAVVGVLLTAGLAAEAKPFPQTQHAARQAIHAALSDADRDAAQAVDEASALLAGLPGALPGLAPKNGALEVRAAGAQPVVRSAPDLLALGWIAAKDATLWTGAYWIEANGRATQPNLMSIDDEGVLLFADAGTLALPDAVDITFHFLGADGVALDRHVGVSRVLDFAPIEPVADLGLALASDAGREQEALFLTPWNTLGEDATLGMTLYAGDEVLDEIVVADCADLEASSTTAGCRLLYVFERPAGMTQLTLWHREGDARVSDLTLTLDELVAGYASSL